MRSVKMPYATVFLLLVVASILLPAASFAAPKHPPAPTPTPNPPVVINFQIISASRAAQILQSVYPSATIRVDPHANAIIVVASGYEEEGMRTIASGIDVKNPTDTTVQAIALKALAPEAAAARLSGVFPSARVLVAPNRHVIVMASPSDMAQIMAILEAIDTPAPTPSPKPRYPAEAVRVTQRNVKQLARAVAAESPGVRVSVSGSEILLSGPSDEVESAKTLIAQLDVPQMGTQYTQVYRLKYVDAASVADLIRSSYANLPVQVNADLNAITVTSNLTVQRRIADALAQLDVAPPGATGEGGGSGASGVDVVALKSAVPGLQGGPSTSAADIATTVTTALQGSAGDLHITVPPNSTELVLTGSPYSIKLARELIDKLDHPQTMVTLDTEVLEVDEGTSKQLGLQFPTAAVSTTLTEVPPLYPPGNTVPGAGQQIPYLNFMPLIRTPMQLTAVMNFLIQNNHARILEDPRITTVSGRTASLRAGETVNILTTAGGGVGTVATTQVQSFQTGVTLDITPVVNEGDYITVTLHPSVNSIAAINPTTGVPNIQSRDTTTTIGLHDGETIVIAGLIEELDQKSTQKIPILGDIPLIGPLLFSYHNTQHTRNELIVTVTPHILRSGDNGAIGTSTLGIPRPEGLPTLPPGTQLPPPRPDVENRELPEPISVPLPAGTAAAQTPVTPMPGGVTATASPMPPKPALAPSAAVPSPAPLPSAFAQTNVYTYGSAPQNNFAAQSAPPQIFFAQVSPSLISDGQHMTISAITTTNVTKLAFGSNPTLSMALLQNVGPGKWQATFNFSTAGLPVGQTNVTLSLTASTGLGATVTLPIPISLTNQPNL
ncbi:MAG: hypothetical protein JO241_03230 [Candidatus Eremiobacteraeota bacterium]|nr:hypothetical protein [Candidatus Eremiobacteraeota bacterium]